MGNQVIGNNTKIFDSTDGETGTDQNMYGNELSLDKESLIQVEIGSGDTVVLEGKINSSASYVVIDTYTSNTIEKVRLPNIYRGKRTVDGGGADSQIYIQTIGSYNGQ